MSALGSQTTADLCPVHHGIKSELLTRAFQTFHGRLPLPAPSRNPLGLWFLCWPQTYSGLPRLCLYTLAQLQGLSSPLGTGPHPSVPWLCSAWGGSLSTLASAVATCPGTPFLPCGLCPNRDRIHPPHPSALLGSDEETGQLRTPLQSRASKPSGPSTPLTVHLSPSSILWTCFHALLPTAIANTLDQLSVHSQ